MLYINLYSATVICHELSATITYVIIAHVITLVRYWIILGRAWVSSKLHLECPQTSCSYLSSQTTVATREWAKLHSQTTNPWYVWAVMLGVYLKPAYILLSGSHAIIRLVPWPSSESKLPCIVPMHSTWIVFTFTTPTLQSGSSPSHSFSRLTEVHIRRCGHLIIMKYLNVLI